MKTWQERLKIQGLTQRLSRKGNGLDNAVPESFFGTLISECFYLKKFRCTGERRKEGDEDIHYDNNERSSLKLKGLRPLE